MKTLCRLAIPVLVLIAMSQTSAAAPPDQQDRHFANTPFALSFIEKMDKASNKDYVVSPLSLQLLLGMVMNGAQGKTAEEIYSVLGIDASEAEEFNNYCSRTIERLPQLDSKTKLNLANALFVNQRYKLKEDYLQKVVGPFRAEVSSHDFKDSKGTASYINRWCSNQTEGLIPSILDKVSDDMLCYLVNALYFKGEWADKFDSRYTAPEPFRNNGKIVGDVPMMKNFDDYRYYGDELFSAVCLPYGNRSFNMIVLLPSDGHSTAEVISFLKDKGAGWLIHSTHKRKVDLWLPRFEVRYHILLNDTLSKMGMPSSFTRRADFKALSPDALRLSFVMQDAVIKVDEQGAEAAAVTSAGMIATTAIPMDSPVEFHADRTFLYFITEASTGSILFAGRYSGTK
ncbi:MAG: serpin family protein [Bacteroidales bacterium]|nr:serpin family protein [Bacteroidales bacterium]